MLNSTPSNQDQFIEMLREAGENFYLTGGNVVRLDAVDFVFSVTGKLKEVISTGGDYDDDN